GHEVHDRDRRFVLRQERRCDPHRLYGLCLEEGPEWQGHLHRDRVTRSILLKLEPASDEAGFFCSTLSREASRNGTRSTPGLPLALLRIQNTRVGELSRCSAARERSRSTSCSIA